MSAPTKTFPADPMRLPEVYTVPGSLRCTLIAAERSDEKISGLFEWLLSISRDQKREAA
jgi:hypothetical protein